MQDEPLSVSRIAVPGQQPHGDTLFPLVLQCRTPNANLGAVSAWIAGHREELIQQAEQHGAILFRGFPLATAQDLDRFIAGFHLENFPYEQSLSNAVRVNYTPRVFSANEAPADVTICLHHEMAQTPVFPSKLFFFCEQPAEEGGATPICRSDVLFEQIRRKFPEFARDCETKGLRYTNVMPPNDDAASGMGRSWQSTFRATHREDAERRMRELGYQWEWQPDGCLRATTPVLPAVREMSPGRKSFFNQVLAAFAWKDIRNDPSRAIAFGDGSPLDALIVSEIAEMAERLTFDVAWQRGDAVLIDNFVAMHGRRTFRGKRKVLASLIAAQRHNRA